MYTVTATAYKGGKDGRQWIIMELRRWACSADVPK